MHSGHTSPLSGGDHSRDQFWQQANALKPKLYKYLLHYLKCPSQAEDIVQDAFLKLLTSGHIDEIENPEAYLHRSVRNMAIDRLRKIRFERSLFDAESSDPPDPRSPETMMCDRETIQSVDDAIAGLPMGVQQAFYWHRIDGVPQKAVAARLGVSRSLVCTYVRRGEEACRRAIGTGTS